MKVAVLYDDVDARPDATPDERGVLESVEAVSDVLGLAHHSVRRVAVGSGLEWIGCLTSDRPDLVFNLCEGVGGSSALEAAVASVLHLLGLPTTGSGGETLALARRKDHVNAVVAAAGVAVPRWKPCGPAVDWSLFPAIVKPVSEDGSVGIRQSSVVRDPSELERVIANLDQPSRWMVQEFIAGREFNVAFVGDRTLPLAEIDYSSMPPGRWPIVSYESKWEAGSVDDLGAQPVCPATVGDQSSRALTETGRAAWQSVGGSGYGRVDVRLSEDGSTAYVLDINPNPDLAPSAGLARAAARDGLTYAELVLSIASEATRS